jgi:DNA-binding NarL/FixJ family response regulator
MKQTGASKDSYRIIIADDHPIIRSGLRALLANQTGIEVCGEASNGQEVLDAMKTDVADMVLMDLTMPDMDGLEATRIIRKTYPATAILALTMHCTDTYVREMVHAGVHGYILKSDADVELLDAIARVRQGGRAFSTQITDAMTRSFTGVQAPHQNPTSTGNCLTQRELEVVRLLAAGKTTKEVAAVLSLSARTAEAHRNHVMRKLRFSSFSQLVRFAVRNSLVDP